MYSTSFLATLMALFATYELVHSQPGNCDPSLSSYSTRPAVQSYCTKNYPLPSPATSTATSVTTTTVTSTGTAPPASTVTVTSGTITVSTIQTITSISTATATGFTTVTATTYVYQQGLKKRAHGPFYTSFTNMPAASQASICSCIETRSPGPTTTVTQTSTFTATTNSAAPTITVTGPTTVVATSVTTSTTVTTVTTTISTAIATATITAGNGCTNTFVCNGNTGSCGLSSICTCFSTGTGLNGKPAGFCSSAINSNGACKTSSDCPRNNICVSKTCAGKACIPNNDPTCINPRTQSKMRMLERSGRMTTWSDLRGRYVSVVNHKRQDGDVVSYIVEDEE